MMKSIGIGICALLMSMSVLAENNIMFEKANQLYHNRNYDSAARLYLQMIEDGYCHADLYYNAGNAFYRSNKTGMSVWCYKKALQCKKEQHYIDNLFLAEKRIKKPIQKQEEIFFIRWWKGFYQLLTINGWAVLGLIFFVLSMVILTLDKFFHRITISKSRMLFLFSLCLISLFLMGVRYHHEKYHFCGILIQNETPFVSGGQTETVMLSEGIEVEYVSTLNEKFRVKLPDGRVGLINANAFRRL